MSDRLEGIFDATIGDGHYDYNQLPDQDSQLYELVVNRLPADSLHDLPGKYAELLARDDYPMTAHHAGEGSKPLGEALADAVKYRYGPYFGPEVPAGPFQVLPRDQAANYCPVRHGLFTAAMLAEAVGLAEANNGGLGKLPEGSVEQVMKFALIHDLGEVHGDLILPEKDSQSDEDRRTRTEDESRIQRWAHRELWGEQAPRYLLEDFDKSELNKLSEDEKATYNLWAVLEKMGYIAASVHAGNRALGAIESERVTTEVQHLNNWLLNNNHSLGHRYEPKDPLTPYELNDLLTIAGLPFRGDYPDGVEFKKTYETSLFGGVIMAAYNMADRMLDNHKGPHKFLDDTIPLSRLRVRDVAAISGGEGAHRLQEAMSAVIAPATGHNESLKVPVVRVHKGLCDAWGIDPRDFMPELKYIGDAGADAHAAYVSGDEIQFDPAKLSELITAEKIQKFKEYGFTLGPGETAIVYTPLHMEGMSGQYATLKLRSGRVLSGSLATQSTVIDSGFNGVLSMRVVNTGRETMQINYLDRLFQVVAVEYATPAMEHSAQRGSDGNGSSGK